MRIPIASDGYRFIAAGLIITGTTMVYNTIIGGISLVITLFLVNFFRDPNRSIPSTSNAIVSPADGKITQINDTTINNQPYKHVVIFLSVFNVHINRIPIDGTVTDLNYKKGAFKAAFDPEIDKQNERMEITMDTAIGTVKVVQIAGLLARRIVTRLALNQTVRKGNRFGMIKFSSRTDLYIPSSTTLHVTVGDTVKGASSIIATHQ